MKPKFFATATEWRAWLEKNYRSESELVVGFYKTSSGRPSMTWSESVDEALCFGWIDAIRKSIDEESYQIRFTKRRKTSTWSRVNLAKMDVLMAARRVLPEGIDAWKNRSDKKPAGSYEQKSVTLNKDAERELRSNPAAWNFFQEQAPWYRRKVIWWLMNAKKVETRSSRLRRAIAAFAEGRRIE